VSFLFLAAVLTTLYVVRSQWFFERVRQLIVSNVETATGGRVEVGFFRFNWTRLRAEIGKFTLHGLEPAEKPPLFHAAQIAVGVKVVSVLRGKVDIRYLEVQEPHLYLIVGRDGKTNVPEPKIKHPERPALETILDLAIGRFDLTKGLFEVESHGATPFEGHGRNLNAQFQYDASGPRYRGNVAMAPLEVKWANEPMLPFGVNVSADIERNRIGITRARITHGESRVDFSGAVEDLASPHGRFPFNARLSVPDGARILHLAELKRGTVDVGGTVVWGGSSEVSVTGNVRASNVDFQDSTVTLRDCRLEGALKADARGADLTGARITGTYVTRRTRVPAEGRIVAVSLRGRDLDLRGVTLTGVGGTFQGNAHLRNLKAYTVEGTIAGFEARRVLALYSTQSLPWDAQASGTIGLTGTLGRPKDLRLTANLAIAPAGNSAPVRGSITAAYEAQGETLDLGNSTLELPSSRVEFSGVLGRSLAVRASTHDLGDILPALGEDPAKFPVKLDHGSADFNGTVTGNLETPTITGKVTAARVAYSGKTFDSLAADVIASANGVKFDHGELARGKLLAHFAGSVGPHDWKFTDDSPVAITGAIDNADVADLATLAGADVPATGTLSAKGQISGTIGKPSISADLTAVNGTLRKEAFDRITMHAGYSSRRLEVTAGQLKAGAKELQFSGTFDHAADHFDQGWLAFRVSSNTMSLEEIPTLEEWRPGLKGTVRLTASGALDVGSTLRVVALDGELSASALQLAGQLLGNARVTATSQNGVLRTRLESDFANSAVRGEGEWRLEGDYPGSSTITFSKLDFGQLRAWIAPNSEMAQFQGSVEGELRIEGPALKPAAMKAELRIPKLEIGPSPETVARLGQTSASYVLHNSGPIVATMANSIVTISNAHFTGRSTDLTVSGRVLVDQKNPLDLRVAGKIDLAILHDFQPDLTASGSIATDAAIRGPLEKPQVSGRLEFQNAGFSVVDFPNGISKATGMVLFTADRATIQSFKGETGGGTIELSGSASYGGDQTVFQLRATASQVRVRYPEGVSTVADANLSFTGTPDRSMLSGTITVIRTGFNPQSDFGSLIASSAQPVRTPSGRAGILGGLNFDIQINTSPDIQFQSSLTEDLQVDANLRLRGTVMNPAVLGRITITQGQLVFFGTKYNIDTGVISFFNPVRIEPVLNIDLTTRVRGIDITLSVTGPLSKPKLTPRSDPPMEFNEIVALLAGGGTPSSDPTMLAQQSLAPQTWQQSGATALLGSAIASPVAGRLQRFFGVSQLRIDPTLPGVESNNPQARITIEKQVNPAVTLTYITNVTTTNPQIVRVEWSVSKQWSVVLLRDENGTGSVDFFFKRRF
jgi:translocation and assembly module TamB